MGEPTCVPSLFATHQIQVLRPFDAKVMAQVQRSLNGVHMGIKDGKTEVAHGSAIAFAWVERKRAPGHPVAVRLPPP